MMALLASAVGNTILKSPAVDALSAPKSSTAIAALLLAVVYINAPRAVIVAFAHVVSAKSMNAVVPEVAAATSVSVLPPAV